VNDKNIIFDNLEEIDDLITLLLKLRQLNVSGDLILNNHEIDISEIDQFVAKLSLLREEIIQGKFETEIRDEESTDIEKILEDMDFLMFQDSRKPMISTSFSVEEEIIFQRDKRIQRAERFELPTIRGSMNFVLNSLKCSLEIRYQCIYEQLEQYDNEECMGDSIPKTKQEIDETNDEFELYIQTRDLLKKNEMEACLDVCCLGDNITKIKQENSPQTDKRLERAERFRLLTLKKSGDSIPKTKQEIDQVNDEFELYIQTRDALKKNE
jgi:hypothetical protein